MGFEVLHPKHDRDKWLRTIDKLPLALWDIHWTPDYLAAEELRGHQPRLATYTYDKYVVCQPIIVRDIFLPDMPSDDHLPEMIRQCRDISSPYGYGGPASNHSAQLYSWFAQSFATWTFENQIVTEFCALHPFMTSHQLGLFKSVPNIKPITRKQVVWIDLTTDFAADFHDNRRAGIKNAIKNGVVVKMGGADEFIRLYRQTMMRKQAAARWCFSDEYLTALCAIGTVWYASIGNYDQSAALLLRTPDGAAYYHLAANAHDYPAAGANDLLIHEMAQFAVRNGCKRFHLGGGATSDPSDSVLFFKGGFSDLRAPAMSYFRVSDWKAYEVLCAEKKRREIAETGSEFTTVFEPMYRREML